MSSMTVISAEAISSDHPIALQDLAHACGADTDWVFQLVEVGILGDLPSASGTGEWRFHSAHLQTALEASRLQRDFGVSLDAAALILDLQHEVRRLKAALQARGL
jgi:chaperone modulatory protein CbpM